MNECICEQCQFDRLWKKLEYRPRVSTLVLKRGNIRLVDIWDLDEIK